MTALSDLEANDRARDLAKLALAWFERHRSVEAMNASQESIVCIDDHQQCPDRIFYLPADFETGPADVRFGHIIMRQGFARFAKAAVAPFKFKDRFVYVICAMSEFTSEHGASLAPDVAETNFVHEATHVFDFKRFGYLPEAFRLSDMDDLQTRYYNSPHEFNAFFHQGLDQFRKNLDLINAEMDWLAKQQRLYFIHHMVRKVLYSGFWDDGFTRSLNKPFRRKLLKRVFRLLGDLPLHHRASVLSLLMARHFAGEDIRRFRF